MPAYRKNERELTPEQRAAVEAVRAKHRTPEYRAEEARVRELVREEFPPARMDEETAEALAALRLERERQGLSLVDVAARMGVDKAYLSRLERGQVANPTLATLRAYYQALGKRLVLAAEELPAGA